MTLATAFAELRRKHKLFARQNFQCCQSCGFSALSEQIDLMPKEKRPAGVVFFHRQDNKDWTKDGYTYLAYDAIEGSKLKQEDIGKTVMAVLIAHGCPVEWDGKSSTRIKVWADEHTMRTYTARKLGAPIERSA